MNKLYSLEFAVKSATELQAMKRLKALGILRAEEAKLSDLDRQAGLFIIRVDAEEAELSDVVYEKLLVAKDVFILSDELSAKRAQEIIKLTAPIEQQIKKLLICVLPETEKVLNDIIEAHQKHKSDFQPTSRIEWCKKINDFSFGELPKVLEEDLSELAKKQLLSSEGLISLIASANDFEALRTSITELSKPKTVWNSINAILDNPVEYSYISGALLNLCKARNDAAHLNTITTKYLAEVEKDQKHVMSYIGKTKSSYRESLKVNIKNLTNAMKPILDLAVKIDPSVFTDYQKMMSEMFKPFTETISKLKLDILSPELTRVIKQNADHQSQIAKSFSGVFDNMKAMDGFQQFMGQLSKNSFSEYTDSSRIEIERFKLDLTKMVEDGQSENNNDAISDKKNKTVYNEIKGTPDQDENMGNNK